MIFPRDCAKQLGTHVLCGLTYIFLWIAAAPIGYNLLKNHSRASRWVMGGCFLLISFFSFGFLGFWLLAMPLICVELALEVNTKLSQGKKEHSKSALLSFHAHKEFHQIVVLALVIFSHLLIYLLFAWFSEAQLSKLYEDWFGKVNTYFSTLSQNMEEHTQGFMRFKAVWNMLIEYIPAVYFGSFILGFYSCFWNTHLMKKFRCPDSLFWLTLLFFSLGFLNWDFLGLQDTVFLKLDGERLQFWSRNLFFILACMYFFQGISVLGHIMGKLKIARFWQNMWYILIILNIPTGLVFIGLVDFIFEFRSRR